MRNQSPFYSFFGEATFYHERVNEFLNVAKSLDIKEIGKNEEIESEYLDYNLCFKQEVPVLKDVIQSNEKRISSRPTNQSMLR